MQERHASTTTAGSRKHYRPTDVMPLHSSYVDVQCGRTFPHEATRPVAMVTRGDEEASGEEEGRWRECDERDDDDDGERLCGW